MNPLNQKTQNLLEVAAGRLRPHLNKLSNSWKQSYKKLFPEDPEMVVRTLDKLNVGTLANCLESRDIECCIENITYHGRRLAKLGVSQEKIATSLRLYLQAAHTVLKEQKPNDGKEIIAALEQLQLVEMIVALQSYTTIENEEFKTLISIMDVELTTERLDEFLKRLLTLSIKTMHAQGGQILLIDQEDSAKPRIVIDSEATQGKTAARSNRASAKQRVCGDILVVLDSGKPIFIHSGQRLTRTKRDIKPGHRIKSQWAFPIKVKSETIGALLLRFTKHYECLPRELEAMETLLDRAALAIERVLLRDRIRTNEQRIRELSERIIVVQDEERRRISRELHDETSHSLLVLKLYLEMINKELPRSLEPTRKKAKDAIGLIEKMLKEIRRLISDLGPAALNEQGLLPALKWHGKTIADISKMKISMKVSKNFPRLPKNLEVVIFRIVQEGLNNAVRHSKATRVEVHLKYEAESVSITIKDNGVGFEPEQVAGLKRRRSFGLLSMKERITMLGGSFAIESSPREGTQINVTLPAVAHQLTL
jgi:signal transduction histidine kinase